MSGVGLADGAALGDAAALGVGDAVGTGLGLGVGLAGEGNVQPVTMAANEMAERNRRAQVTP
jgi:hypothetical protein